MKTPRSWAEGCKLADLCLRLLDHLRAVNGLPGYTHDYDGVTETQEFLDGLDDIKTTGNKSEGEE